MTLALMCPNEPAAARAFHDAIKVDAATGTPVTPHGRYWLATRRPWPGLGHIGECGTCLSTLLVLDAAGEAALADDDAA